MTPDEFAQYRAKCAQHFRDEESGKVTYVDFSHTFPPYVPLPTEDGQVVAVMIPHAPSKKRRWSVNPTLS
jgi:hypothetical protein